MLYYHMLTLGVCVCVCGCVSLLVLPVAVKRRLKIDLWERTVTSYGSRSHGIVIEGLPVGK